MLVFFHRLCPAVIALDIQESFGISGTLLGILASAYFYPYALMQLPTGLMADAWGPRKTVSSFFLIAAVGSAIMGSASSLEVAVAGRILVGLGVSTLFVCNFKLLAEWFTPRQFVIAGGIFMAMGGIGALSASAPLAWLSDLKGWRMTLLAVGILTLVLAVLVYGFVRDRPSEIGLMPCDSTRQIDTEIRGALWAKIRFVVCSGRFWPIAIWAFSATGISFAIGGLWGGPYLMQVYGMSKAEAGGVLSMFAMALVFGSPTLSWAANRFGRKPVLLASSLMLVAVCGLLCVLTKGLPLPLLYLAFFCLFLAGGASGPIIAAVSKELFPPNISGTSIGTVNFFPFFGAAFFQVLIGVVVVRGQREPILYGLSGFREMFVVCLAGAIFSLAAALFIRETMGKTPDASFGSCK